MPKLSLDEIDIMLNDDEDDAEVTFSSNKKETSHKLEVKRRLDNHFEHKRMKRDLGYEYYD